MLSDSDLAEALRRIDGVAFDGELRRVCALEAWEAGDPRRLLYDRGPETSECGFRFTPPDPDGHRGLYCGLTLRTAGSEYAPFLSETNRFQLSASPSPTLAYTLPHGTVYSFPMRKGGELTQENFDDAWSGESSVDLRALPTQTALPELPWPDPDAWLAAVQSGPLAQDFAGRLAVDPDGVVVPEEAE